MEKKYHPIIPTKIAQDLSPSVYTSEIVYSMTNLRTLTTEGKEYSALTPEKGNTICLYNNGDVEGSIIGSAVVNENIVLFTTSSDKDRIYKLSSITDTSFSVDVLYEGNLNFSLDHPIQCLVSVENEKIKKVYWIDGINQLRVINIAKEVNSEDTENNPSKEYLDSQFDVKPVVDFIVDPTIKKIKVSNSYFDGGVVQYAISFFNLYGQETGIVYQSPLYYTAVDSRGLNPDGSVKSSDAFSVVIPIPTDIGYDHIRIYRIFRTSIDATPSVDLVGEFKTSPEEITNIEYSTADELEVDKSTFSLSINDLPVSPHLADVIDNHAYGNISAERLYKDMENWEWVYYTSDDEVTIINGKRGDDNIKWSIPKQGTLKLKYKAASNDFPNGILPPTSSDLLKVECPNMQAQIPVTIKDGNLSFVDNGKSIESIDPTELLYKGGTGIVPNTFTHKDNVLFLGDITLLRKTLTKEQKKQIKESSKVSFVSQSVDSADNTLEESYTWNSSLDKANSEASFFKCGEVYRVGVQLLSDRGEWSEVIYLGDFLNNIRVQPDKYSDNILSRPVIKVNLDIPLELSEYIAARVVVVYPEENDRNVLCQGIVLPTIYNVKDRIEGKIWSSWFSRPSFSGSRVDFNNIKSSMWSQNGYTLKGFPVEYLANTYIPFGGEFNSELQYGTAASLADLLVDKLSSNRENIGDFDNTIMIDKNIVTFHSPELDDNYTSYLYNVSLEDVKFRVIGYAPQKTSLSKVRVTVDNPFDPYFSELVYDSYRDPATSSPIYLSGNSMSMAPFWIDGLAKGDDDVTTSKGSTGVYARAAFPLYPWQKSNSLNNQGNMEDASNRRSILKNKVMSNLRVALPTRFVNPLNFNNIPNVELYSSSQSEFVRVYTDDTHYFSYFGNVESTLNTSTDGEPIYIGAIAESNSLDTLSKDAQTVEGLVGGSFALTHGGIPYNRLINLRDDDSGIAGIADRHKKTVDPISIKYKSTPHAVFSLGKDANNKYNILPNNKVVDSQLSNVVVQLTVEGNSISRVNSLGDSYRVVIYSGGNVYQLTDSLSNLRGNYLAINFLDRDRDSTWESLPQMSGKLTFGISGDNTENVFIKKVDIECIGGYLYRHDKTGIQVVYECGLWPPSYSQSAVYRRGLTTISYGIFGENFDQYVPTKLLEISLDNIPKNDLGYAVTSKTVDGNCVILNSVTFILCNSDGEEIGTKTITFDNIENEQVLSSPYNFTDSSSIESLTESYTNTDPTKNLIWEQVGQDFYGYSQTIIPTEEGLYYYFLVGELYRDNVSNRFGGTNSAAILNNTWLPCGDLVELNSDGRATLYGNQGDTFYSRYDCLKTYPFTNEDTNSVVDIVSFLCETRVNIDGRYDRNRGLQDNTNISPTNFNLYNPVYNQHNNFFSYNTLDEEKYVDKFPNQLTYTLSKVLGADIDNWTNITLANTYDLDGDKGKITSLCRFNNELYALQEKGFSRLLYNSRAQINVTDGIPLEIANSGKFDGIYYLSDNSGCQNKWAVSETPFGIFFIDDNINELYCYNGQNLNRIASSNSMMSWFKKNNQNYWKVSPFEGKKLLFDTNTEDLYVVTADIALSYNSKLSCFTSFYSYGKTQNILNIKDNSYMIRIDLPKHFNQSSQLWKAYNGVSSIYGYPIDFEITLVANPEFTVDKVFDAVEFSSSDIPSISYNKASYYPFDSIEVTNEYQHSLSTDVSAMKKKFRTWRWQLPRDGRNRIRNMWTYIKLSKTASTTPYTLYNFNVAYYK